MTEQEMQIALNALTLEFDDLVEGQHVAVVMAAASRLMIIGFAGMEGALFEGMLANFVAQVRAVRDGAQGVQ